MEVVAYNAGKATEWSKYADKLRDEAMAKSEEANKVSFESIFAEIDQLIKDAQDGDDGDDGNDGTELENWLEGIEAKFKKPCWSKSVK
jgi:hypothetical protein